MGAHIAPCVAKSAMRVSDQKRGASMRSNRPWRDGIDAHQPAVRIGFSYRSVSVNPGWLQTL